MTLSAEQEADENSNALVQDAAKSWKDDPSSSQLMPIIKSEPQEGEQKEDPEESEDDKKLKETLAGPRRYLRQFQEDKTTLTQIQAAIQGNKFTGNSVEELGKIQPKLKWLINIFETMIIQEPIAKHLQVLARKTIVAEAEAAEIKGYTQKMGYFKGKGKK